jgi:hypothetical protein
MRFSGIKLEFELWILDFELWIWYWIDFVYILQICDQTICPFIVLALWVAMRSDAPYLILFCLTPDHFTGQRQSAATQWNCIIARIKFILSCLVFVDSLSNIILYQVYNDFRSRMRWLVSLSAILVQLYRLYMFVGVLNGGNKDLIMRVMKGGGPSPSPNFLELVG